MNDTKIYISYNEKPELIDEIIELRKQRDELLAACKIALIDGKLYKLSETINRILRIAIAKAEDRDDA